MSTYTHVEQTTPATPSTNQQVIYPKVGGVYTMASDGIEKQILDSRSMASSMGTINMLISNLGGF